MHRAIILYYVFAGVTLVGCSSEWSRRADQNTVICLNGGDQEKPELVSDGEGGAIIVWQDLSNGLDYDIYAQRIDHGGAIRWRANGIRICATNGNQVNPKIISDGAHGAIIVWEDNRDSIHVGTEIYATRIDANGNAQWSPNGRIVCAERYDQLEPALTTDGNGGAIITWTDRRTEPEYGGDIYAQRLDRDGARLWIDGGVPVCVSERLQSKPQIASDGLGGAVIAWGDGRNNLSAFYLQRLNASGSPQWTPNGIPHWLPVATANGDLFRLVPSTPNGCIAVWGDEHHSGCVSPGYTSSKFNAQKFSTANPIPAREWNAPNPAMCVRITNEGRWFAISSDGAGGVIVFMENIVLIGRGNRYFAQRISRAGARMWSDAGVEFISEPSSVSGWSEVGAAQDGSGGGIVAWQVRQDRGDDILAQRITTDGRVSWMPNGVTVTTAVGNQSRPRMISDGDGGAIVVWEDNRFPTTTRKDIFAQRINSSGNLGNP